MKIRKPLSSMQATCCLKLQQSCLVCGQLNYIRLLSLIISFLFSLQEEESCFHVLDLRVSATSDSFTTTITSQHWRRRGRPSPWPPFRARVSPEEGADAGPGSEGVPAAEDTPLSPDPRGRGGPILMVNSSGGQVGVNTEFFLNFF